MSDGNDTQAQAHAIISALQLHPRVVHQQIATTPEEVAQLEEALPRLVSFSAPGYYGFLPVLDWDHRLPSRVAILRVYAYYGEMTYRAGEAELSARTELIAAQDKYPEFDVPDFGGLSADEAYEGEVDPSSQLQQLRLVSSWRRDINPAEARAAVQVVRRSEEFKQVVTQAKRRPDYLGDLEAVSWTPPCETGHKRWTVDVWYLMDLDAAMGRGRSFLVDPKRKRVIGLREFVVRSG
jgi:hypothetical protein